MMSKEARNRRIERGRGVWTPRREVSPEVVLLTDLLWLYSFNSLPEVLNKSVFSSVSLSHRQKYRETELGRQMNSISLSSATVVFSWGDSGNLVK